MNKRYVVILIVLVIGIVAGAFAFAYFRAQAHRNACLNNLRMVDAASQSWGCVFSKTRGDEIDVTDACSYLKDGTIPVCPSGGKYTVPPLGLSPHCSVHGALWQGQDPSPMKFEPGWKQHVEEPVQQHGG